MEDRLLEKKSNLSNEKKIGQITFGITLILLGISVFVQSIVSFEVLRYVLMMWPLIFISLGVELVYYSKKDNINIKYDIWGVILIFIILGCTTVFSVVNYGVNKILYNDEVKNVIVNNTNNYEFYNKVKLINIDDKKVNVKITEEENYNGSTVYITGNLNNEYIDTKGGIELFNDKYSIYNVIEVKRDSSKSEEENNYDFITISELPECYENISINIVTNNRNNIEFNGEFSIN